MERVRLMCWCRSCVSGVHLPAFAASEGGLFAARGLEVEFVDCVSASDRSLRGYGKTLKALGENRADFALSSVAYLLAAQTEARGSIGARFAAVFHQRNPIAGLVLEDSEIRSREDLSDRPTASLSGSWFLQEFEGALARLDLGAPAVVEPREKLHSALASGEIEVIPAWVDMTPGYSKESPIRAIPLDFEVYATGLAAADRLSLELVLRMRDALVEGCELQREQPELGIAAFRRRFPNISEEHLQVGWSVFEPYLFDHPAPGSMDAARWQETIDYTAAAHDLCPSSPELVYRPELLVPAYAPA